MAIKALDVIKASGDEATGVEIVRKAIEEPIRFIAENAGRDGAVVVDTIKRSPKGFGYDAAADEFGDMIKKGIIDPTKVVRSSLQNASSIACMVLITESLVADIPEKKEAAAPQMPGGGGYGGGGDF
jgi:chaperonin GroEL